MNLTLYIIFGTPLVAVAALQIWKWRSGIATGKQYTSDSDDFTLIHHNYSGHSSDSPRSYEIPKDPDAYARLFVPPSKDEP